MPVQEFRHRITAERNIVTMSVRDGANLNWIQRFGYSAIALFCIAFSLTLAQVVAEDYRQESYFDAFIWLIPVSMILAYGVAVVFNLFRFPRDQGRQ